jgi:predicted RNA polymerase sigma factor
MPLSASRQCDLNPARCAPAFQCAGLAEVVVRPASVLHFVYLIFNEGYAASCRTDWIHPTLCDEIQSAYRGAAAPRPP